MKTIDQRITNIIEWFRTNHKEFDYISWNNVYEFFIKTENPLRADWEKVRHEKGWKYLHDILVNNNIPHLTEKQYRENKFNQENEFFKNWIINNHTRPDRLSYQAIVDYLKKNGETNLLKTFRRLYRDLKQEGLIQWFAQIGLKFYIQDNKKDLNPILSKLKTIATQFYNDKGYTPGWSHLEEYGFNETKYLRTDGWNLNWQIEDLNNFYQKNDLPKIPSKSEMAVSDVKSINIDSVLDNIISFFGNIPSLSSLKTCDKFYDFCRYLRIVRYHSDKSENDIYNSLWDNKFGKEYVKMTRKIISIDGYWCDSIHELMFYNYLHLNGVQNNPHVPYSTIIKDWDTNYICDNILPNLTVCEIAGYHPNEHKDYWRKINEKMMMCSKHNIQFVLINGYEFINTNLEKYLDYIHYEMSQVLSNLKKPNFFEVIKSQHTVKYLEEIFNMFKVNNHFTIPIIKESLSKESYRFFMNHFQSIKEFIKKYNEGFHKEFPELKDININFNEKTYSRVFGLSYDERLGRGIRLLAKLISEENLKTIPSSKVVENNYPKYRKINDMFRNDGGENYWLSITRKESGYDELCNILGYKVDVDVTPKDYYGNIQNLIDDLIHMKNMGNGMWIGVRHDLFKTDYRIRRIHNYIGRECKTVVNFRNKYSDILSEIGFIYKGKNTKLV